MDSPKSESSSVKAGSDVRGSPDGVGDEQIDKTIVPYGSVDEGNAGFIATPLHKEDMPLKEKKEYIYKDASYAQKQNKKPTKLAQKDSQILKKSSEDDSKDGNEQNFLS